MSALSTTHVSVRVAEPEAAFDLGIRDDGHGFSEEEVEAGAGLRYMPRRAEELNGTLHLLSEPGHGTTIRLILPRV